MRAAAALVLCACTGTVGTVQVELVTAPDSHVLDPVTLIRLTLTNPRHRIEASRGDKGFNLGLEIDASNTGGALILEGFDATGKLVACGQTPVFPESAINATVSIYVAVPRSIGLSPASLDMPLSEVAATALSYGAVLAGGRDAGGAPTTSIAVYNTFNHTLTPGVPLPEARAGIAMGTGSFGSVYLFGGVGPTGQPTGTLWRFDTTVPPKGLFFAVDQVSYVRTGERMVPLGSDHFLVTGTPPLDLNAGVLDARSDIAALPPAGASLIASNGTATAVFVDTMLMRLRGNKFDSLGPGRANASATTLPNGRIVIVGGGAAPGSRDVLVVDSVNGGVVAIPAVLATPRMRPLVAATSRHLVIAGGTDASGVPIASAEVLDATKPMLDPIITLPLVVPRSGGFAIALPNDQVLIGGGAPGAAALELFTPEPPPPPSSNSP